MVATLPTAQVLTVGDELLTGAVVDTNLARIGQFLREHGIHVVRAVSVGDDEDEITHALRQGLACDLCLVSGGLGPTSDDRTAAAIAKALGRPLELHAGAHTMLTAALAEIVARRRKNVDASSPSEPPPAQLLQRNLKQAYLPRGAQPIANRRGTAPGIEITSERDGQACLIICLPGVPRELSNMLDEQVSPRLRSRFAVRQVWQRIYRTLGVGESWVGREVEAVVAAARERSAFHSLQIHYLPNLQEVTIGIELPRAPGDEACTWLDDQMLRALGSHCYGIGPHGLPTQVVRNLTAQGLTVATADACSGGQMGVLLTGVPGASRCLIGGIDAYANRVKTDLLGVAPEMLADVGAVSKAVALAMSRGVRERLRADIGVALTGIAGPSGGSPQKPVGTVDVAICDERGTSHRRLKFAGSRVEIQHAAAMRGIGLVWRRLAERGYWTQIQDGE